MKPAYPVIAKIGTYVYKINDCWLVGFFADKYFQVGFVAGQFPTRREARDFARELKAHWKYLTKLHSGKKPDYSMVIDPKSEE